MNLGVAVQLEAERGGPLAAQGAARAIEAGWLIPGGSLFLFELGVRGVVMAKEAEAQHELGLFGGARADLLRQQAFGLMPFIRGGLGIAAVHLDEERLGLGPYLALGLSWELLPGVALAFEATGHARIAPFSVALGGAATIIVQSW